ncbi:MAG: protein-glutamate O-methyltransferase [Pseudomonadota bacterium]
MPHSALANAGASRAPETGEESLPDLSATEFRRVAEKAMSMAGIVLKEHKMQMVTSRLTRRLRALNLMDFESYLSLLDGPRAKEEVQHFINAVTTNLTSFFREDHHFDHLDNAIMARLAAQKARRVRIWSAGCSTGEEPYSIALTVRGSTHWQTSWDLKILATDLDTNVLAKAEAGLYKAERGEAIPKKYSRLVSQTGENVQMGRQLQDLISFRQLNLLEQWPVSGPFDAIFCRNVMIYFDSATKARLVERFAELLGPEGVLFLGHSESLLGEHPMLTRLGQTTYGRRM